MSARDLGMLTLLLFVLLVVLFLWFGLYGSVNPPTSFPGVNFG